MTDERLARAVAYRDQGWLAKFLTHPVREAVIGAYRLAPWLPVRRARASLFTGQSLSVLLPELVAADLYRHGCIEPGLTALVLESLRPGMTFVDVGAQYGYYSMLAHAAVGAEGRVIAFEPGRRSFQVLKRNLRGAPNAGLENRAAARVPGTRRMHDFGVRHSALNSLFTDARAPARERSGLQAETYEVESVSLDDYFEPLGLAPDFVKIDAESAELEVLLGMERLLRSGEAVISIEVGDFAVAGAPPGRRCIEFLRSVGYAPFECRAGDPIPHRVRSRYEYGNLCFRKLTA